MKRGQYSLEFLLTYGWAFLAITIALAAIYSFGFFNIDEVLPQKCEFFGQIFCEEFTATSNAENSIKIIVINRFGANLNISNASVYDNTGVRICDSYQTTPAREVIPDPYGYADGVTNWLNGEEALIDFQNCNIQPGGQAAELWQAGERFEGSIEITFYNPSTKNPAGDPKEEAVEHTQVGQISVFVAQ